MPNIALSYVMTTYNKLPYLREVLPRLIENCQPDEEIVIVDGGSRDGSREHLSELYRNGRIHQFISEPDAGEAHGTNKGILRARGEMIKIVTDDDCFHYPGIRTCRDYMVRHPEYDFLSTDGVTVHWNNPERPGVARYRNDYTRWKNARAPFGICGLGWMIRKSSLPLLGLPNPNFIRMDAEYSLRVTSSKARLAWYTGIAWARLLHPFSNAKKFRDAINAETRVLKKMYATAPDESPGLVSQARYAIGHIKAKLFPRKKISTASKDVVLPELFTTCDQWLTKLNAENVAEFLQ